MKEKEAETRDEQRKRIRMLIRKHERLLESYVEPVKFKEPVIILVRQTGKAEFYEEAKGDKFIFTHSNGKQRFITIGTKWQIDFDYGKKSFKGYLLHENHPVPLTEKDPIVPLEEVGIVLDKTLHDKNKWEAEVIKQKGEMYWKIAIGIGAIILAYTLYKLLVPTSHTTTPQEVKTVTNTTVTIINETIKNITI